MEGSFEYRNLLSNVMTDYNNEVSEAKEKFEAKNAIVEGVKASIERATDIPAGIFLTKPLESGVKYITGKEPGTFVKEGVERGVKKVSDIIKSKLERTRPPVTEAEPRDVTFENPLYEGPTEAPEITTFEPRMTSAFDTPLLDTLPEEEVTSRLIEAGGISQARAAQAGVMDQLAPMREMMQRDPRGQAQPEADTQANAQATTQSDSAGATDSAGSEGGIGGGAEEATTDAVAAAGEDAGVEAGAVAGAEVGLDALGPVGWIVGLFLGIGTLVGGIEGADSVKNPSVPKPPHMASVATQFGIGQ